MHNFTKEKIKEKMAELRLSYKEVENKSGIPKNSLWKLINSERFNPTLKTISALSEVFHCSISDLVDPSFTPNNTKLKTGLILNKKLYKDCTEAIFSEADKRAIDLNYDDFTLILKELYAFSIKKNSNKSDKFFLEFILEKLLNRIF